ncbi:MAG: retroviral-like aspartic protease family protein [Bacteroidales bacterium]|nr:retroviral-like aspartic protease family protein [Bacteroidales bacterium]
MNDKNAFTINYGCRKNCVDTQCMVSSINSPSLINLRALWDTGANASVISKKVVQQLDLKPTGFARIIHANGQSIVKTYIINLYLPNKLIYKSLFVTEGDFDDTDVLIGMDVISSGDFALSCKNGDTTFSFQYPSRYLIDFVRDKF